MKRMRIGYLAAVLLAVFVLGGCGGGKEEEVHTPSRTDQSEEEEKYVEQSVKGGEYGSEGELLEQSVWQYGETVMYEREEDGLPYVVKNKEDGSIEQETCSWEENWEKKFKKKYVKTMSWQKLDDKTFYVYAIEYSMPPKKAYGDWEKYKSEFYAVHAYLLRLDAESGEIQEIPVPQKTNKEYYKELGKPVPAEENESMIYDIQIMPNGNFLLLTMEETMICDGVTGEKLCDLDLKRGENTGIYTAVGDGFVAVVTEDSQTHKCELHVFDSETGTEQHSIPLDFEEKRFDGETSYANFALGASADSVLIVYDKCIYKVDYGEEELKKVLDADENRMFYLTDEEYLYEAICMGEKDDYFVKMMKESENYNSRICHYFKKGTEKNEE